MDKKERVKGIGTMFCFVVASLTVNLGYREEPLNSKALLAATLGISLHYFWTTSVDRCWGRFSK